MSMYLQYLPEGIVIRRKGDGEEDPVVTTIGPGVLAMLANDLAERFDRELHRAAAEDYDRRRELANRHAREEFPETP